MNIFGSIGKHTNNRVRVRINSIRGNIAECAYITSNYKVKALIRDGMNLEAGQIVLIEYAHKVRGGQYVVVDDLSSIIEAEVLEAHHIISADKMYTSIIVLNKNTNERLHSLIPSIDSVTPQTARLFSVSKTLVKGDIVKIKVNSGTIFSIKNCSTGTDGKRAEQ